MAAEQLIFIEKDGSLSFGNYRLEEKSKLEDFKYNGDLMKCKTYSSMTKLERNGMFVYESEPGTNVFNYTEGDGQVEFTIEGKEDAMVTVGLEENTGYEVIIDGESTGTMNTNMSGKLSFNAILGDKRVKVLIKKQ